LRNPLRQIISYAYRLKKTKEIWHYDYNRIAPAPSRWFLLNF